MADKKHDEEHLLANNQRLQHAPDEAEAYVERGQILSRLDRYDEALTAYAEALERNPEQDEALRARGHLCFERGDLTQALADWDSLFMLQKADEEIYLGKIQALIMLKNLRGASDCCEEAIRKYPHQTTFYARKVIGLVRPDKEKFLACEQVLFLYTQAGQGLSSAMYCDKGQALTYLNRYREVLEAYEQALSLEPHNPDIYVLKAYALRAADRESEAGAAFEEALKLYDRRSSQYPHAPFDLIQKSALLCSLGRFQESYRASEQALQLDSGSARAWFAMGEALFQLQRFPEARAAYEQSVKLVPAYERIVSSFGFSLGVLLRYERNLADCEQRLRAAPGTPLLLIERAYHLLDLKRSVEALECSEQALQADPGLCGAYIAQGTALYALKRYPDAALAYQQAIKLRPEVAFQSIDGYEVESQLEYIEGIARYDAVLQKQPADWESMLKQAELHWRFGHYEDGQTVYRQACQAVRDNLEALVALASHYAYDTKEALRCCERALLLSSTDYRVYAQQGVVFYYLRRYDEALAASAQALQLHPESWQAADTRKKIEALFEEKKRMLGNLINPQIEYLRLGGAAWNAWRASQVLPVRDLRYLVPGKIDLQQADLSHVDLSHSDLSGCNLTRATLYGARLEATSLSGVNLTEADARQSAGPGLNLSGADLSGTNLHGADLSHANLEKVFLFLPTRALHQRVVSEAVSDAPEVTNLSETNLQAAQISTAFLDYVLLAHADLREANLRMSLLRFANLRHANLSHANLSGASLAGADLTGALLCDANLAYADLRGANLTGADLRGANLFQTLLADANLSEVDLSQTVSEDLSRERVRKDRPAPLFSSEQPMAPARITTVEMRAGIFTTVLYCQAPGCSETMQVELVVAGTEHEDDQNQLLRAGVNKPASFICDYLPGYTQSWHPSGLAYARLELALRQGDIAALNALDRDYAPFYCWRCHGVYCYQHMRFQEIWDDFYPHPDYWVGTCPYGHPTMVDH